MPKFLNNYSEQQLQQFSIGAIIVGFVLSLMGLFVIGTLISLAGLSLITLLLYNQGSKWMYLSGGFAVLNIIQLIFFIA